MVVLSAQTSLRCSARDSHSGLITQIITLPIVMHAAKAFFAKIPLSIGIDIRPRAAQMTFDTFCTDGELRRKTASGRLCPANRFVLLFTFQS